VSFLPWLMILLPLAGLAALVPLSGALRTRAIVLALVFVGSGIAAVLILPEVTGTQYVTSDLIVQDPTTLNFMPVPFAWWELTVCYLWFNSGIAICAGALIAVLNSRPGWATPRGLVALVAPFVPEVIFRGEDWWLAINPPSSQGLTKQMVFDVIARLGPCVVSSVVLVAAATLYSRRSSSPTSEEPPNPALQPTPQSRRG